SCFRGRPSPLRRLPFRPPALASAPRPALGGGRAKPGAPTSDLVVLGDLDPVAFGRRDDLPPRRFLGAGGFELRLVPPGHRVTDVRLVVYRQVPFAVLVHVGEPALIQFFPVFRIELSHCYSFLFPLSGLLHPLFRPSGRAATTRRRDRNPLYATGTPRPPAGAPSRGGPRSRRRNVLDRRGKRAATRRKEIRSSLGSTVR